MTEQEIREMPAGREMDALVAEKVMGSVCGGMCGVLPMPSGYRQVDGYCFVHSPQPYSTRISAAWKVVEVLLSAWGFTLTWLKGKWHVGLTRDINGDRTTVMAHEETVPLAICCAALLTVEA